MALAISDTVNSVFTLGDEPEPIVIWVFDLENDFELLELPVKSDLDSDVEKSSLSIPWLFTTLAYGIPLESPDISYWRPFGRKYRFTLTAASPMEKELSLAVVC